MTPSLSPRELARVLGVSESSLKRWADGGRLRFTRTAGGHRRISVPEAVGFARRAGLPILHPEALGVSAIDPHDGVLQDLAAQLGQSVVDLLAGDDDTAAVFAGLLHRDHAELARSLITGLYLRGHPMGWIFDTVVCPALNGIGVLYLRDRAGIYLEHRAFDVCVQAVNQLRSLIPPPADDAPAAAGGGPPGDVYLMPSLMAAAVLADAGFRVVNLGAQIPLDSLRDAATHYRASMVWLACACTDHAPDPAEVGQLAADLEQRGATLLLGGIASPRGIQAPNTVSVESMTQLAAFAAEAFCEPRVATDNAPSAPSATR